MHSCYIKCLNDSSLLTGQVQACSRGFVLLRFWIRHDTVVIQKGKKPVKKKTKTDNPHATGKEKGKYKWPQEGVSDILFRLHMAGQLKHWYYLAKCQMPWAKEGCRREWHWRDFHWGGIRWQKCLQEGKGASGRKKWAWASWPKEQHSKHGMSHQGCWTWKETKRWQFKCKYCTVYVYLLSML